MSSREMEDLEIDSLIEGELESEMISPWLTIRLSPENDRSLENEFARSGTEIMNLEQELIETQGRVLSAADRDREYQNEIESLKAALSRQRADASSAFQKVQGAEEIRKNLEFEIGRGSLRISELEDQIELEKRKWRDIEARLKREIEGRRVLAAEAAKNAGDLERERSLVSDLEKKSSRLQEELIDARARVASLGTEIDSERQKGRETEERLRREIEGRRVLSAETAKNAGERERELLSKAGLEKELFRLKGELEINRSRITELEAQIELEQRKRSEIEERGKKSPFKAAVEEAQSEIARLKQELSAALEKNPGAGPSQFQEDARKKSDDALGRAQIEITTLREEIRVLKSRAEEVSEPQPEIRMQSAPLESLGDDAAASDAVLPIIEPALLEPAWNKILGALRKPVLSAQARLRQLASLSLAEGPRAILKFALSSLAEISDTLKILGEYLDEAGAPGAILRAETVIEAAVGPWEPFLRSRRIALVRQFSQPLGPVFVNQEALRTAIYQIVRNAFEAMPRGGVFTVKLELDPSSQEIRAIFSDTGPGFSDAALSQVFTPFATTRLGHLGLGLALTRNILRRYGGDAEAKNAEPKGGLVTLRFSSAPAQLPPLEMIN